MRCYILYLGSAYGDGYRLTGVAPVSWTVMDLGKRGVAGSVRS